MTVESRATSAPVTPVGSEAEWGAGPLCPVAHWVVMEGALTCVWEVPNPMVPA